MLSAAFSGALLGASLIIAIGSQNAFILRQGLLRSHVFVLCLICALSDAVLIAAGVAGLGTVVAQSPRLIAFVTIGGAVFLGTYGVLAFRRAWRPQAMRAAGGNGLTLPAAIATCLAFTFLNPHVYLDTVLLLGSLSAAYEGTARFAYGAGAAAASFVWFFGLGYGARLLQPVFAKPAAWRVLDAIIGVVMSLLALSLLYKFYAGA
ncbi:MULTISPECIES: LysE/ArgO family amino acid transporter [Rhizobium]|uniref:LysE/ArgO family amino acid transporter n=1 Tax=Rhizobium rhododendri TaxID=2506430 RepID=A0ABY8INW1_9HYPH|nr:MULTISPECIES: LysE/ArgO family amino acid transporter [Rhizobium]MBZ5760191.1 LysE/ArgO family amino acid transporter [Rhizobium sp. VS19-DR96]MBZ5766328.1 LysE/ArgO family amino acid transporter [Rhizobium sp. VS19-DR129.2]MBZ5774329.1 LysE/ArgO family amino acid transporter [Rhizobium sp. VS19-DRK62.2]MBZ5785402.1 LysE/ArgO family amino acid transporter [Rhizobium sp. VS19-DR121]MBZ5803000.1 LysE/ArgO family amino acid transporter [Rhizobium sp. VS19-DR181]